jgi:branched-chain amino acid transport system permease protein
MLTVQIINGVCLGSMYALVALGFTFVLGVFRRLSFALPALFALGGFAGLAATAVVPTFWAAALAAAGVGGVVGMVVGQISFARVKSEEAGVAASLSSLALGLMILDLLRHRFGGDPIAFGLAAHFEDGGFTLGATRLLPIQLLILTVTAGVSAFLYALLAHTMLGRRIRAVADSPIDAGRHGINVRQVAHVVFFLSGALVSIAGLLFALRVGSASTDTGLPIGFKALAIMAIGGLGDLRGAVVGGVAIGVLEALGVYLGVGGMSELVVWVSMILILIVRPKGLFGRGHELRDQRV